MAVVIGSDCNLNKAGAAGAGPGKDRILLLVGELENNFAEMFNSVIFFKGKQAFSRSKLMFLNAMCVFSD